MSTMAGLWKPRDPYGMQKAVKALRGDYSRYASTVRSTGAPLPQAFNTTLPQEATSDSRGDELVLFDVEYDVATEYAFLWCQDVVWMTDTI
jgi:hypothetical protein